MDCLPGPRGPWLLHEATAPVPGAASGALPHHPSGRSLRRIGEALRTPRRDSPPCAAPSHPAAFRFAAMIPFRDAYRGSNLPLVTVTTAGRDHLQISVPPSTSLLQVEGSPHPVRTPKRPWHTADPEGRSHGSDLLLVHVRPLHAEEHELRAHGFQLGGKSLGGGKGVNAGIALEEDSLIRPHGQPLAEGFLGLITPQGQEDDLPFPEPLLDLEASFDGELVIGADNELHSVGSMDTPSSPKRIFVSVSGVRLMHTTIFKDLLHSGQGRRKEQARI